MLPDEAQRLAKYILKLAMKNGMSLTFITAKFEIDRRFFHRLLGESWPYRLRHEKVERLEKLRKYLEYVSSYEAA